MSPITVVLASVIVLASVVLLAVILSALLHKRHDDNSGLQFESADMTRRVKTQSGWTYRK